jgi:hypothetical protein
MRASGAASSPDQEKAMRTRFALTNTILALAFVVAGCASSGATSTGGSTAAASGPASPISIVVDNNTTGLNAFTISISKSNGGSGNKVLGPVDAGRRKTFSYDATEGNYQLIAKRAGAPPTEQPLTSQVIQINGATTVTWHLQTNTIVEGQ